MGQFENRTCYMVMNPEPWLCECSDCVTYFKSDLVFLIYECVLVLICKNLILSLFYCKQLNRFETNKKWFCLNKACFFLLFFLSPFLSPSLFISLPPPRSHQVAISPSSNTITVILVLFSGSFVHSLSFFGDLLFFLFLRSAFLLLPDFPAYRALV